MPKFGQVLGTEGEKLSVWRRLILIFPEERWVKNSNFVTSNVYANPQIGDVSYMQAIINIQ